MSYKDALMKGKGGGPPVQPNTEDDETSTPKVRPEEEKPDGGSCEASSQRCNFADDEVHSSESLPGLANNPSPAVASKSLIGTIAAVIENYILPSGSNRNISISSPDNSLVESKNIRYQHKPDEESLEVSSRRSKSVIDLDSNENFPKLVSNPSQDDASTYPIGTASAFESETITPEKVIAHCPELPPRLKLDRVELVGRCIDEGKSVEVYEDDSPALCENLNAFNSMVLKPDQEIDFDADNLKTLLQQIYLRDVVVFMLSTKQRIWHHPSISQGFDWMPQSIKSDLNLFSKEGGIDHINKHKRLHKLRTKLDKLFEAKKLLVVEHPADDAVPYNYRTLFVVTPPLPDISYRLCVKISSNQVQKLEMFPSMTGSLPIFHKFLFKPSISGHKFIPKHLCICNSENEVVRELQTELDIMKSVQYVPLDAARSGWKSTQWRKLKALFSAGDPILRGSHLFRELVACLEAGCLNESVAADIVRQCVSVRSCVSFQSDFSDQIAIYLSECSGDFSRVTEMMFRVFQEFTVSSLNEHPDVAMKFIEQLAQRPESAPTFSRVLVKLIEELIHRSIDSRSCIWMPLSLLIGNQCRYPPRHQEIHYDSVQFDGTPASLQNCRGVCFTLLHLAENAKNPVHLSTLLQRWWKTGHQDSSLVFMFDDSDANRFPVVLVSALLKSKALQVAIESFPTFIEEIFSCTVRAHPFAEWGFQDLIALRDLFRSLFGILIEKLPHSTIHQWLQPLLTAEDASSFEFLRELANLSFTKLSSKTIKNLVCLTAALQNPAWASGTFTLRLVMEKTFSSSAMSDFSDCADVLHLCTTTVTAVDGVFDIALDCFEKFLLNSALAASEVAVAALRLPAAEAFCRLPAAALERATACLCYILRRPMSLWPLDRLLDDEETISLSSTAKTQPAFFARVLESVLPASVDANVDVVPSERLRQMLAHPLLPWLMSLDCVLPSDVLADVVSRAKSFIDSTWKSMLDRSITVDMLQVFVNDDKSLEAFTTCAPTEREAMTTAVDTLLTQLTGFMRLHDHIICLSRMLSSALLNDELKQVIAFFVERQQWRGMSLCELLEEQPAVVLFDDFHEALRLLHELSESKWFLNLWQRELNSVPDGVRLQQLFEGEDSLLQRAQTRMDALFTCVMSPKSYTMKHLFEFVEDHSFDSLLLCDDVERFKDCKLPPARRETFRCAFELRRSVDAVEKARSIASTLIRLTRDPDDVTDDDVTDGEIVEANDSVVSKLASTKLWQALPLENSKKLLQKLHGETSGKLSDTMCVFLDELASTSGAVVLEQMMSRDYLRDEGKFRTYLELMSANPRDGLSADMASILQSLRQALFASILRPPLPHRLNGGVVLQRMNAAAVETPSPGSVSAVSENISMLENINDGLEDDVSGRDLQLLRDLDVAIFHRPNLVARGVDVALRFVNFRVTSRADLTLTDLEDVRDRLHLNAMLQRRAGRNSDDDEDRVHELDRKLKCCRNIAETRWQLAARGAHDCSSVSVLFRADDDRANDVSDDDDRDNDVSNDDVSDDDDDRVDDDRDDDDNNNVVELVSKLELRMCDSSADFVEVERRLRAELAAHIKATEALIERHSSLAFFSVNQLRHLAHLLDQVDNAANAEQTLALLRFAAPEATSEDVRSLAAAWRQHKTDDVLTMLDALGELLNGLLDAKLFHKRVLDVVSADVATPTLEPSALNLVLRERQSHLVDVLQLFAEQGALPRASQVLFCTPMTSDETLNAFIWRALHSASSSDRTEGALHCMIDADLLPSSQQESLVQRLQELCAPCRLRYRLVLLASPARSVVTDYLHAYTRAFFPMPHAALARLYDRVFPDDGVCVYESADAGAGKTFALRRWAARVRKPLTSVLVHEAEEGGLAHLVDRLIVARRDADKNAGDGCALHIDVSSTAASDTDALVFRLAILRQLDVDSGQFFCVSDDDAVLVELPSLGEQQLQTRFPFLCNRNPLPRLMVDARSNPLDIASNSVFADKAQKVLRYLRGLQEQRLSGVHEDMDADSEPDVGVELAERLLAAHGLDIVTGSKVPVVCFVHYMYEQLLQVEASIFLRNEFAAWAPNAAAGLPGIRDVVVANLCESAKDFALSSSPSRVDGDNEEAVGGEEGFALIERWNSMRRPLLLFNQTSVNVMGGDGDFTLLCRDANQLVGADIEHWRLQRASFVDFGEAETHTADELKRDRVELLLRLFGVVVDKENIVQRLCRSDFALTWDNVLKMAALYMRVKAGIPCLLEGESGCGKTTLVAFLADLLGVHMVQADVHGGFTLRELRAKVNEACAAAREQRDRPVWLFFDEINTAQVLVGVFKELLCDRRLLGVALPAAVVVLAAANPFRRRPPSPEDLHASGLEQHGAESVVPQLVYNVVQLPQSLANYRWVFGALSAADERLYISELVAREGADTCESTRAGLRRCIGTAHDFVRRCYRDVSAVSLRDVVRCLAFFCWFTKQCKQPRDAVLLAIAQTYYFRLRVSRPAFATAIDNVLKSKIGTFETVVNKRIDEQVEALDVPEGVGLNATLAENVFVTLTCVQNRVPVVVVGEPGCSKTLSMDLLLRLKDAPLRPMHAVAFQCSRLSTAAAIEERFAYARQFQSPANATLAVLLFDEIGLAEQSKHRPLKVLHRLLEHPEVAFVGLSNWRLDAAKMNRVVLHSCVALNESELVKTARAIVTSVAVGADATVALLPKIVKAYCVIVAEQQHRDFFGKRDFYSAIRAIATDVDVERAFQRNFGGMNDRHKFVHSVMRRFLTSPRYREPSPLTLIADSLSDVGVAVRHVMCLATDAFLWKRLVADGAFGVDVRVLVGSAFIGDRQSSLSVYERVNGFRQAMESGERVVLVACDDLYGSLYACLNLQFIHYANRKYCRIALGAESIVTRVHDAFKCVVVVDAAAAHSTRIPIPFLNRFEKQMVSRRDLLQSTDHVYRLCRRLRQQFGADLPAALPGFSVDATVASALEVADNNVDVAFELLLWAAAPEATVRHRNTDLGRAAFDAYFKRQQHIHLPSVLAALPDALNLVVRTFCFDLAPNTLAAAFDDHQDVDVVPLRQQHTQLEFEQRLKRFFSGAKHVLILSALECEIDATHASHVQFLVERQRAASNKRVVLLLHLDSLTSQRSVPLLLDAVWPSLFIDAITSHAEEGASLLLEPLSVVCVSAAEKSLDTQCRRALALLSYPASVDVMSVLADLQKLLTDPRFQRVLIACVGRLCALLRHSAADVLLGIVGLPPRAIDRFSGSFYERLQYVVDDIVCASLNRMLARLDTNRNLRLGIDEEDEVRRLWFEWLPLFADTDAFPLDADADVSPAVTANRRRVSIVFEATFPFSSIIFARLQYQLEQCVELQPSYDALCTLVDNDVNLQRRLSASLLALYVHDALRLSGFDSRLQRFVLAALPVPTLVEVHIALHRHRDVLERLGRVLRAASPALLETIDDALWRPDCVDELLKQLVASVDRLGLQAFERAMTPAFVLEMRDVAGFRRFERRHTLVSTMVTPFTYTPSQLDAITALLAEDDLNTLHDVVDFLASVMELIVNINDEDDSQRVRFLPLAAAAFVNYAVEFVFDDSTDAAVNEDDVELSLVVAASQASGDGFATAALQHHLSPLDRQRIATAFVRLRLRSNDATANTALMSVDNAFALMVLRAFELELDVDSDVDFEKNEPLVLLRHVAFIKRIVDADVVAGADDTSLSVRLQRLLAASMPRPLRAGLHLYWAKAVYAQLGLVRFAKLAKQNRWPFLRDSPVASCRALATEPNVGDVEFVFDNEMAAPVVFLRADDRLTRLCRHWIGVLRASAVGATPLHALLSQSVAFERGYVPGAPADALAMVRANVAELSEWRCERGHPFFVGNCGRPVIHARCMCGALIGGVDHKEVEGNRRVIDSVTEAARGIRLFNPAHEDEVALVRGMPREYELVVRLLVALTLGGLQRDFVKPLLFQHDYDVDVGAHVTLLLEALAQRLQRSAPACVLLLHEIVQRFADEVPAVASERWDDAGEASRDAFERWMCNICIAPVLDEPDAVLSRLCLSHTARDVAVELGQQQQQQQHRPVGDVEYLPQLWQRCAPPSLNSFGTALNSSSKHLPFLKCVLEQLELLELVADLAALSSWHKSVWTHYSRHNSRAHMKTLSVNDAITAIGDGQRERWTAFVRVWNRLASSQRKLYDECTLVKLPMLDANPANVRLLLTTVADRDAGMHLWLIIEHLVALHNQVLQRLVDAAKAATTDDDYSGGGLLAVLAATPMEAVPLDVAATLHTFALSSDDVLKLVRRSEYAVEGAERCYAFDVVQHSLLEGFVCGRRFLVTRLPRLRFRGEMNVSIALRASLGSTVEQQPLPLDIQRALVAGLQTLKAVETAARVLQECMCFPVLNAKTMSLYNFARHGLRIDAADCAWLRVQLDGADTELRPQHIAALGRLLEQRQYSLAPDRLPASIVPSFCQPLTNVQVDALKELVARLGGTERALLLRGLWQFLQQYGSDAEMSADVNLRDYLAAWQLDDALYSGSVFGELDWFDRHFPRCLSLAVCVETYRALRKVGSARPQ